MGVNKKPILKRVSTLRNNRVLRGISEAKSKTWPSRLSKTGALEEIWEDAEQENDQANDSTEERPVISLPYEDTASSPRSHSSYDLRARTMNPDIRPHTADPRSDEGMSSQEPVEQRPASALPQSPGQQIKPRGLKKVVSLLSPVKGKTEPTSPRVKLPFVLPPPKLPSPGFSVPLPESPYSIPSSSFAQSFASSLASTTGEEIEIDTPLTDVAPTPSLTTIEPVTEDLDDAAIEPTTEDSDDVTSEPFTEDPEDAAILSTKQAIRDLKLADASSTQHALHLAYSARDTGIATLGRLANQSERLANVQLRLHEASVQTRITGEQIRDLKHARKFLRLSNPFFASTRISNLDDENVRIHQAERAERAALRRERWEAALSKRVVVRTTEIDGENGISRIVERAKYQFEPDEEDELLEVEIEKNLEELGRVAPELREIAVRVGERMVENGERLERAGEMMDRVGEEVVRNRCAIGRID